MNKSNHYNENSIKVYEYPENIQNKPTMYIGNIGMEGCTHLIRELMDNSIDECLNGFGNKIIIKISNKKGSASVEDFGRGIPPTAIEKAFCTLHASGKFDNNEYSASAGTNGVGTTAVNALSKSFIVESVRENKHYIQKFSNGLPITKLKCTGDSDKSSGTKVYIEPNKDFMEEVNFDFETIKFELETKKYVLKNVEFILINEDTNEEFKFLSANGIDDYIKDNIKESICRTIKISNDVEFNKRNKTSKFNVELAFSYDKKSRINIISFCNSLLMREGGIQETTFKTSLTRFFKSYIENNNLLAKKDEGLLDKINGDHVTDGLVAIISIRHPDPLFENQTKNKLKSKEIGLISKLISEALDNFASSNTKDIKNICNKIIISIKAYEAAKKARETVQKKGENQFAIVSDLSKLANCISKDTEVNEIFITEGRSASGTAKEARDKNTQAVYSLRGKMLNTIGMDTLKVLANKECADLAYILTGIKNAIDDNFNIDYLKYGKVIMLCDADVDGYHISMLGLTYIFEHMRPIITEGHMYIAIPPLYSIIEKGKKRYFVDQYEYDQYIYEKILKNYKFIENNKPVKTIKKLTRIFEEYDKISKYIEEIVNNNIGVSKELIFSLFNYLLDNDYTKENIVKFLKGCNDIILNDKKYEGFFNENYVYFTLNNIISIFNNIFKYANDNNISFSDIYYNNDQSDNYNPFNISVYDEIISAVTPKSRVRLKGKTYAPYNSNII
jgi:DNA gyrase subunit B